MALYTVQVPDPAPGADWLTTVPGQYLWDVKGITATLRSSDPDIAHDVSGHGNDMDYTFGPDPARSLMRPWPGVLAGDGAQRMRSLDAADFYGLALRPTPSDMDWSGAFTIETWFQATAITNPAVCFGMVTEPAEVTFMFISGTGQIGIEFPNGSGFFTSASHFVLDGGWHYYALVYTPGNHATNAVYVDGDPVGPLIWTGTDVPLAARDINFGIPRGAPGPPGAVDELAVYPYALTAAQVGAHFEGAPNFDDYSAAVLADSPGAYFHLDEIDGNRGRQACLEVTDGATSVLVVPSGFAEAATGSTFRYSWQPGLGARTQNAAQTLTTIPTPGLLLPAGYVVRSLTLDLQAGDQWTDVLVWWDSGFQDASGGIDAFAYPPGAHLVYHPRSTAG